MRHHGLRCGDGLHHPAGLIAWRHAVFEACQILFDAIFAAQQMLVGVQAGVVAPGKGGGVWQRRFVGKGVGLNHVRVIGFGHPRHRVKRQAVTHGRIARHQVHALIPEKPRAGGPGRPGQRRCRARNHGARLERQHITDHRVQPLHENAPQAFALHRIVKF